MVQQTEIAARNCNCGLEPALDQVKVRPVRNDRERDSVYQLRYSVYVEEMGWSSRYGCPLTRRLTDSLDETGTLFAAFRDGQVIGTLRTHHSGRSSLGIYKDLYRLDGLLRVQPRSIAVATMFVVGKQSRRSRVAWDLLTAAARAGLEDGIETAFIDCVPSMVSFYQKLGCRTHIPSIVHPEYGKGVCMLLSLRQSRLLEGAGGSRNRARECSAS
jgi:N-acyl-L-homoserine lactone synthetase